MCRGTGPGGKHILSMGERRLSDIGLSPQETTILQVARCYFQSFAVPASHGWLQAHRTAAVELPEGRGPAVAAGVLDMVQGLRVSRRSVFRFSNPFCAACARILTPHERLMMATLTAYRTGRTDEARGHATLLCEGNGMEEFLQQTERLAHLLRQPETAV